jgi:hypothetical protein
MVQTIAEHTAFIQQKVSTFYKDEIDFNNKIKINFVYIFLFMIGV